MPPVYTLTVGARFEAAHHLTSYRGAPEPVHGHSWRVEATLETDALDGEGMAWDFVPVKRVLDALASELDHRDLNALPVFAGVSPTTERVAAWFFHELAASLPAAPLAAVTVWEGPDCAATYRPPAAAPGRVDRPPERG